MKKYITKADVTTIPLHFDIVVDITYFDESSSDTVVATEYKGFQIPDGPLISGIPGAVLDSQALIDYEDFIESVTDLITDYYELDIYYKNTSSDHSNYFGMLAKNDKGEVILDFDFTLRVSNHDPHRSSQSQQHKKERKEALNKITKGKKTKPITHSIVVNSEIYNSYIEAYADIDKLIEGVVEVMKRREKYHQEYGY